MPKQTSQVSTLIEGSFPESQWEKSLPLVYSPSRREMSIEVWVKPGDRFRLMQKSQTYLHPCFSVVCDPEHGNVNVYLEKGITVELKSGTATRGKVEKRNEDAFYATRRTLAVADGVSAWRSIGIDAGEYSRELLRHCEALDTTLEPISVASLSEGREVCSLVRVLEKAWKRTLVMGSCTVLLAHLETGNRVTFLCLGDCRAIIIRYINSLLQVVFRTDAQIHDFNVPYQLAKTPKTSSQCPFIEDSVEDAVTYTVETQPGDYLVLGTDGLWDNLYEEEVLRIIRRGGTERELAQEITETASRKARSTAQTPFGERKKGGSPWVGGKPDDITTIVARITDS